MQNKSVQCFSGRTFLRTVFLQKYFFYSSGLSPYNGPKEEYRRKLFIFFSAVTFPIKRR